MYIQPSTVQIGGWSGPRSWVVIVVQLQPVGLGLLYDYYFEQSRPPYLLLLYWHQLPSVVTDIPIPMSLGSCLFSNRFLKPSSNIQIRASNIKGNPNPNPSPSPPFQIPHVKRCLRCGTSYQDKDNSPTACLFHGHTTGIILINPLYLHVVLCSSFSNLYKQTHGAPHH